METLHIGYRNKQAIYALFNSALPTIVHPAIVLKHADLQTDLPHAGCLLHSALLNALPQ